VNTATHFQRAALAWLDREIADKVADIANGVPVHVYKERVAYLRALRDVAAHLPKIATKLEKEGIV